MFSIPILLLACRDAFGISMDAALFLVSHLVRVGALTEYRTGPTSALYGRVDDPMIAVWGIQEERGDTCAGDAPTVHPYSPDSGVKVWVAARLQAKL
jgi:hypothetical protein